MEKQQNLEPAVYSTQFIYNLYRTLLSPEAAQARKASTVNVAISGM
jgi:hypothetical protein